MKITAIRAKRGWSKRVKVFLDGKSVLDLEAEVVVKEQLHVAQELSAGQIEALTKSDRFHRCLNSALHYLSYRPRSEFEVKQRLKRHCFDSGDVEAVIAKLKKQGLVDDTNFALFWKDNRQSFSPRSRQLTRFELKQKGVADDIIDETVDAVDDADSAYQAALRKARSLVLSDYQSFRRQLGQYLRRRGFGYDVINQTTGRIWQERVHVTLTSNKQSE